MHIAEEMDTTTVKPKQIQFFFSGEFQVQVIKMLLTKKGENLNFTCMQLIYHVK